MSGRKQAIRQRAVGAVGGTRTWCWWRRSGRGASLRLGVVREGISERLRASELSRERSMGGWGARDGSGLGEGVLVRCSC